MLFIGTSAITHHDEKRRWEYDGRRGDQPKKGQYFFFAPSPPLLMTPSNVHYYTHSLLE